MTRNAFRTVLSALAGAFALASCNGGAVTPPSLPTAPNTPRAAASHGHSSSSSGYSLFGDAILVHPGHNSPTAVQASWDPNAGPFGGIDFAVPAGLTFNQLTNLSSDFQITQGTCGQGSPRFVAQLTNGTATGYAVFYFGGSFAGQACPQNVWINTTNMASGVYPVDTSQGHLPGGTLIDTYATAELKYGTYTVTDLFIVVDGFLAPIYAQFDNTQVNDTTYTYESADSCKDGGYKQFTSSPGPFKNQGDCVSYFATGGKH